MKRTAYSYCDLCLSACGMEVDIEDGRIVAARGDRAQPLSRGYLCTKGKYGPASRQRPERLRRPLKRTEDGWEEMPWEQAYREIAARLREIRERHGPQAIGMYYGADNPTSFFNYLFAQGFMAAPGSRELFKVNTSFWHPPLSQRVRAEQRVRISRRDAERAGIQDGDDALVSTATGTLRVRALVTDDIMPGVVSIPYGWGRRLATADGEAEVGVNVNVLTDDSTREPLTGRPVYNGVPCRLEKAGGM